MKETNTKQKPVNDGKKLVERDAKGRIKKGSRLNPAGKPKGTRNWNTFYDAVFEEIARQNPGMSPIQIKMEMTMQAIKEARKGDFNFFRYLTDREFGKPKQPVEHSGKMGLFDVLAGMDNGTEEDEDAEG